MKTPIRAMLSLPFRVVLILLVVSGGLLYFPLRNEMGTLAASLVLGHLLLGVLLFVPCAFWSVRLWKDRSFPSRVALIFGLLAFISGLIMTAQALRGVVISPSGTLFNSHLISGFLAIVLLVFRQIYLTQRRKDAKTRSQSNKEEAQTSTPDTRHPTPALLFLILFPLIAWTTADRFAYNPEIYSRDLTAVTTEQAENPLFPAQLRLPDGENNPQVLAQWNRQNSATCAAPGCHPKAHAEWKISRHATSATNPVYRAVLAEFQNERGKRASLWCASCHAPQAAVEGNPDGHTGVDCLSCHAMQPSPTQRQGNGAFSLAIRETYPFASETAGWRRNLYGFLMRIRPAPHSYALHNPGLSGKSEACAPCHRQSYDVAQNGFQFVRTMDTYGEWHDGDHSGRTIITPFPRSESTKSHAQECQSCHFRAKIGTVSHLTPGSHEANSTQHPLSLDLFALRSPDSSLPRGEAFLAPLDAPDEQRARLPLLTDRTNPNAQNKITLDLLVTNEDVGHAFPGGYEDLREAWLEITLRDAKGEILQKDRKTRYGKLALDRNSNPLTRHNLHRQTTTAWRRVLLPGASDLVRFGFQVPSGDWSLTTELKFRAYSPEIAGMAKLSPFENPVVLLATAEIKRVGGRIITENKTNKSSLWERWTRYGLSALALRDHPDLSRSFYALHTAQSLAPQSPTVALALGRYYLREPALLAAKSQYEIALTLNPQSAEAHFGLGTVFRRQGQYDAALAQFVPLLTRYPEDTALRREIGEAYYYTGRYADAAQSLEIALVADPDDERAHFQLEQCYLRLQKIPEARREAMICCYLGRGTKN